MSAKGKYVVDSQLRARKVVPTAGGILRKILYYFLGSVSLAVIYYALASVVLSSDLDRKLMEENRAYAREYARMEEHTRLLEAICDGLEVRDDQLYEEIFRTAAPAEDRIEAIDIPSLADSITGENLVRQTREKLAALCQSAGRVEANLQALTEHLCRGDVLPPMNLPLKDFSYPRTGASVGSKVNPFTKVPARHDGLDLLAQSGETVLASAPGTVEKVIHSQKGGGNTVIIRHPGGYASRYAHLSDIKVRTGQKVKAGSVIGTVGMSGNSFLPHLHYEVTLRDSLVLDPVNTFFADLTPAQYTKMLIISRSTGKSMD